MKKTLLTMILMLVLGGSFFAQETHWPGFDEHEFNVSGPIVAYIQIDGQYITNSMNYASIEVCPFVGEEQRGFGWFMVDYGFSYPVIWGSIFYNLQGDSGKPVSFKMFDHESGIEYDICTTSPEAIVTGGDYTDFENMAILNFTSPAPQPTEFPLDITGYGEGTGNYYLIASPIGQVSPGAVTNMIPTSGGYDLFYFDQTKENEWINYKEGDNSTNPGFSLEPGKGYLYARQEGATLTFTGTAYSGDGTFDLVYSTTNSDPIMHGWNLMGNPFATTATVNRDCYVMGEGGSEIILSENRSVEAMQGVFVKALATKTEPKVTFEQGNSTGDGAKVVLNVRKDRAATIDRAMVRFNDNSSLPKFMLDNSNTKIYIPQNGDQYAVVSGGNESSLPVNFKAKENGTYTLNIEVENVDMDYLHLIDHKTGDDVDLLVNPNYTFQARSTDYAERFTLVYANTTGLEENFAFFNGSKWVIGNEGKATLQIMDVVGRLLSSEQINGSTEVSLGQPAGVYVMRLINGDNVKTQKVVVR
jgi:hypothetical protein